MNLDEFMWRYRRSYRKFAEDSKTSQQGLAGYIRKKYSPSLLTALKMYSAAGGKVSLIEMLSKNDLVKLEEFFRFLRLQKAENSDCACDLTMIDAMDEIITDAKKTRNADSIEVGEDT